jgi:Reverse transcriptase (RNA-dependent DNA polymerase)
MHMIFDIKQEDMRHKARFVVGGHVIDSSNHTTYSSTISDISVRLLMLILIQNSLELMVGDVVNAFLTAPCAEKLWSIAGSEFQHQGKEGSKVILKRALYGLKTSSRSFHEFFGDKLRRMGFTCSRADLDLWIKKSEDYEGYDYIATHVDDLIIAAKNPANYMNEIEQEFLIRNKAYSPSYYLGNDIKQVGKGIHISSKKYATKVLRRFQAQHGDIRKKNIPMSPKAHPELAEAPPLDLDGVKQYHHIIGVCQWFVVTGRFDIAYAVSSLSRFSSMPRIGHLELARKL